MSWAFPSGFSASHRHTLDVRAVVVSKPPPITNMRVPTMLTSGRGSPLISASMSALSIPGRGLVRNSVTYSKRWMPICIVICSTEGRSGLSGGV